MGVSGLSFTNMLPWETARGRFAFASIIPRSLRLSCSLGVGG